jgi:uncharacterized protein YjbI with pentapeptide repeats
MANAEQLEILKQGVEAWNNWRDDNPDVGIDLTLADLKVTDLTGANLTIVDLIGANLADANLKRVDLTGADLTGANIALANLSGADLKRAVLTGASLRGADLMGANLTDVDIRNTNLMYTDLRGANLTEADLKEANLTGAYLMEADFRNSYMGDTILGSNDLDLSFSLDTVFHLGPSRIGTDTIRKSKGRIPIDFLRGCGLSDWEIESAKLYNPELSNHEIDEILYKIHDLRATQPIQISPLFISYSHIDIAFVNKIEEHLNAKGIRFWRDVHHATAGRLEKQIDRAIRHNPTVLLVLSEHSIKSDWVEHEVRTARELQKELGRDTLCPVALDDSWKNSPWPKRVMEQVKEYNILDFSKWEDGAEFEKLFKKLIDGLELFYK